MGTTADRRARQAKRFAPTALAAAVLAPWALSYRTPYTTPRIVPSPPPIPSPLPPVPPSREDFVNELSRKLEITRGPVVFNDDPPYAHPHLDQSPGWSFFSSHGALFVRRVAPAYPPGFPQIAFSLDKQDRNLFLATCSTASVHENGLAVRTTNSRFHMPPCSY